MKKSLIVAAILAMSVGAYAQFGGRSRFGGGPSNRACLVPGGGPEDTSRKIDHSGFVYARVRYQLQPWWRRSGNPELPWHHDFPDGDTMLPSALQRLTTVHTTPESYKIVDIDSDELFEYPFIYMSEPGYLNLPPDDLKNLREYLDRGGFLLMDDFRGNQLDMSEFENMEQQMKKLYPDRELKLLPPAHPIFHVFYDLDETTMQPPYLMPNSGEVKFFGITDDKGNVKVMIDFNNDISEYWQALDVGQCSLHEAGTAVELGVNYVIYSMTH
jgi:Domain of unknown function (DUF4159)